MAALSDFDAVAAEFDRHRSIPGPVVQATRAAVLGSISPREGARILDLGAGTGRFGHAFVAAGDDYVAVDLSFGMLRRFQARLGDEDAVACLVQCDGRALPFRDADFDAVLLIHAFGGLQGWRQVLAEASRVLRTTGSIVVGRTRRPPDGVDARMKQRLRQLLDEAGARTGVGNAGEDACRWLGENRRSAGWQPLASWPVQASPRAFIERHRHGAQFQRLPHALKEHALQRLAAWAAETFGSIDVARPERHGFELQFYGPPSG